MAARTPAWSPPSLIAFRFAFSYALLFLFSFSAFFVPLSLPLAALSNLVWGALTPWIAGHVLLVPAPPLVSDGDGLGQWIQFGGCAALAALITVIWSVSGRRRTEYDTLHKWLRVLLRYALGIAMVTYGLFKVFHLQMLPPHLAKLVQPLGESSPTSLLWILMGSSAVYSAFTGAAEMLGGILLFHRRTTLLGTLISFGSLAHVVALNLSYDVSVKIWSMNLLAMSVVLIAPDIRRLVNVFVLNRPTSPKAFPLLFRRPKHNRVALFVGIGCLVITFGFRGIGVLNGLGQAYGRTPTPVFGIYQVESFTSNGVVLPPLLTDSSRWKMVVIEKSGLASIRFMDDDIVDYLTAVDSESGTLTFLVNPDTSMTTAGANRLAFNPHPIRLRFEEASQTNPDGRQTLSFSKSAETLFLRGEWEGDAVEVVLSRVDESQFLLQNRGFNWVQYTPYFR